MIRNDVAALSIGLCIVLGLAPASLAQDPSGQQPPTEQQQTGQQQDEKAKLEHKAVAMLEQLISEAQMLKLPENRIRIQITAADLFWDRNQGRARALFADAAAGVAQMMLSIDRNDRRYANLMRGPNQLRQELVLTVARHDSTLAYQLLASTPPPAPPSSAANGRRFAPEANVERNLLAEIASSDPKVAFQKAVELLEKGQYPKTVAQVLAQLQSKDKESFTKLSDKVLAQLSSDSLLANRDAGGLALVLLGPTPPTHTSTNGALNNTNVTNASNGAGASNNPAQVLSESAFHDLMDTVITAALNATPIASRNSGGAFGHGGGNGFRGGTQTPPDDVQNQQNNARGLLMGLQTMVPQIERYLPDRVQAVRKKLEDLGLGNNPRLAFNQMNNLMEQCTTDRLLAAAPAAPPRLQSRLYQQAALKAIEEGNTDRALQIANEHLDESTRGVVAQALEFQQLIRTGSADKMAEIRQALSRLQSDSDRVKLLVQLSGAIQKDNPKVALKFLDEARNLVTRRASNYQQFEDQLQVAQEYAALDPKRSFEVLEPGIGQLNELLSAAALLSGFEVDIFRDGELPIQGGSDLAGMVTRYGQELTALAKIDFERARITAEKCQLPEAQLLLKLTVVQGVLTAQSESGNSIGPRR